MRAWPSQKPLQQAENLYAEQIVALYGLLFWGMRMFSYPVKEGLVSSYKRILVPNLGAYFNLCKFQR